MKRSKISLCFIACLFALSAILSACSSVKVMETWKNPGSAGHRYQKLMILGIAHDENLRFMAENIIVDELGRCGIAAVASHTIIKEIDNGKREDVIAAVSSTGVDGVLTIRAVTKGDATVTQGGQSGSIYGTATNVGGVILPSAKDYALATLQTNLYDSKSTDLVWSATIKTFDAKEVARVSRELARSFFENLRRDGLL